jgi:hypothetical protein
MWQQHVAGAHRLPGLPGVLRVQVLKHPQQWPLGQPILPVYSVVLLPRGDIAPALSWC